MRVKLIRQVHELAYIYGEEGICLYILGTSGPPQIINRRLPDRGEGARVMPKPPDDEENQILTHLRIFILVLSGAP